MAIEGIRILYIAGSHRSGSTLVDMVLGSLPATFSLGEIHNIKNDYERSNRCNCMNYLSECLFWKGVNHRLTRKLHVNEPCFKYSLPALRRDVYALTVDWERLRYVRAFWQAVSEESGATVLIESAKGASLLIARLIYVPHPVYVLHLVRDPRSIVNSFLREAAGSAEEYALNWVRTQRSLEFLSFILGHRYLRVRYEDFCNQPEVVVRGICRFIGIDYDSKWLNWPKHTHHSISGNWRTAAKTGNGLIKERTRWAEELSAQEIKKIERIVGSRLLSYGYTPS